MKDMKFNRKVTGATNPSVELTDELYNDLNERNQVLVNFAELLGVDVKVSSFTGTDGTERKYISSETVSELSAIINESQ